MTLIEILLILIGAGIIIISCFLIDKSPTQDVALSFEDRESMKRELSETEKAEIKQNIDAIITDSVQGTVLKTEDELSRISNEKIIAVSDFSNQIIEKISQNHEEVVFLYNMLNEKESEIKDSIKQLDGTKEIVSTKVNDNKGTTEVPQNKKPENPSNDLNQFQQVNNPAFEINNNNNDKILELYLQGKSIIDISKSLELGQGEVKLVIDLYKKNNNAKV